MSWGDVTGKDSGNKLKHRRFCLNIRKHLLTVRVTQPWHRLFTEVVEPPSSEIFISYVYVIPGNQLYVALLEQERWTTWPPELPPISDNL